jgi:membrane-associated phospholipid phosphatase
MATIGTHENEFEVGKSRTAPMSGFRLIALLFFISFATSVWGQADQPQDSKATNPSGEEKKGNSTEKNADSQPASAAPGPLLKNLVQDQKDIWTSPFRMKVGDLKWAVPFAGITTGLIMTDRTASHEASRSHVNSSRTFSDAGLAVAGASSAGFYFLGRATGDSQKRETGILSGEAMVNALAVDEVLKYAFQRQRPFEANGAGRFFQGGSQNSFPSAHATLSFAFASVLAHEYPGWLTKFLAYGGASAISLARVTGKEHFPSDVFVGATLGYLIGEHVYRAHHDQELDGADYGTFTKEPKHFWLNSAGSTYVELDSWIYPAVERLAALGIIRSPFLGIRPWTRTAVAQMLAEADYQEADASLPPTQEASLFSALRTEFSQELSLEDGGVNESIRVESLYTRISPIAGTPLNDSYHFGQTIINDFGRPYQGGFNAVSGFTSRAETGPFSFYVRGEYQYSPSAAAYPDSVRNVIAQADVNPVQPAIPVQSANQFRLLDAYTGLTLWGNEVSVGKQSLWWGPGEGGAMILSNNAEPLYMLRINRTLPLYIPWISKLLGPIRHDHFFGKLNGHHFPPDPFMYGDKVSFQPTKNLELGFSRTAVFAGQGKTPLTLGTFWRSYTSVSDVGPGIKGTARDPGARHGAFDFSYKLPFVRNWLTLYSDSIAHDEPNPISAPRRAAIVPGIYLSHFPKLNKLDLRVESGYTDIPNRPPTVAVGRFLYWEGIYHDVYLNKGNLMGSWLGRAGKGTQVWSNYWLNSYSSIQVSYRNSKISNLFIPGGGTQTDFSAGARLRIRNDWELLTNLQYEQWTVPVLAPSRKSDFLSSLQLTYWPKDLVRRKPN